MVASRDIPNGLTAEEYFQWEEQQLEKYEYINGHIYAMGGGTVNHGRIAIRFTTLFETHLDGTGCIPGNSDIKVNIPAQNAYTYPDASVTCDERDKSTPNYFTYPCLVVEVLSDSTEAYDRGGKFRLYRHNPALVDYVLVSSTQMEVDLYHKNNQGEWIILNYQAGDLIELKSISLSVSIEEIYRDLAL